MDVIVPVKCFTRAKSRLGPMFNSDLRQQLARVMALAVLTELKQVRGLGRILVITSEPEVMEWSQSLGVETLWDEGADGLNGALYHAEDHLGSVGTGIAVVCADLPFFRAAEFERMMAVHQTFGPDSVTIASDQAGVGTNVRMVTARSHFPYQFGPDSAQVHAIAARRRGMAYQLFDSETFALDLDTPASAVKVFRSRGNNVGHAQAVRSILSRLSEISGDCRSWNN